MHHIQNNSSTLCTLFAFVAIPVPTPPYNLTVLEVTATTIKVEWHEPANPNGLIDGYRVIYINQNETHIQTKIKHKEPGPIINFVLAELSEFAH